MSKKTVEEHLRSLGGNAVVYSELAWAVARKAADGSDRWFPDSGAWQKSTHGLNSGEMKSWTNDWVVLR